MEEFGFDKVPEVLRQLFGKAELIEDLLLKLHIEKDHTKKFLTVNDATEYLQTTVAALYSLVSRKQIPVNKPGKRVYFLNTEFDGWFKAGRMKTTGEIIKQAAKFRQ